MYLCYLDESGTVDAGTTSHFVLLGMSLPATSWKKRDAEVQAALKSARLPGAEIHTAWMMRRYPEQERIANFTSMDDPARRAAVLAERKKDLAAASMRGPDAVKTLGRNYRKSREYIHLSHRERVLLVESVARMLGGWPEVLLFADAQRKAAHAGAADRIWSHAFEQVVTRFHHYLKRAHGQAVGVLVQDNNDTSSRHLTTLMRKFHRDGTKWSQVPLLVETPLFVDSALTTMVQLADLCSYATRRFFENAETNLFDLVYPRFDKANNRLVGLRHYTGTTPCSCRVCVDHGR